MSNKLAGAALSGALALLASAPAVAQSYIGEVRLTANSFCANDSMETNGQILPIANNQTLFALIGCTYGGDCRTTMQLPDLRGRGIVSQSNTLQQGLFGGAESATMTVATMPSHTHTLNASARAGTLMDPAGNDLGEIANGTIEGYNQSAPAGNLTMANNTIGMSSGGQVPFNIRQPALAMRYCIVTDGIFPPRN